MENPIRFKPTTDGSKRPLARNRILSARFMESEYAALESFAWSKGTTLADWVRDVLLHSLEDSGQAQMEMHIFTELVGIQMLLMNTLEPLLRGDKIGPGTTRHSLSPSPNHQGREGAGTPRQAQPEQGEVAMPTVQQWGRKESIIWPPRGYLYTLGAFFLALVATGFFVYVRFQYGLSPLERYYLPYYLRSEMPGLTHHASNYQMLYVSDGKSRARPALEADVEPGATPQLTGAPLPLALSELAQQQGFRLLVPRTAAQLTRTRLFTLGLQHWIYDGRSVSNGSSRCNSFLVSRRSYCSFHFRSARTSSGIKELRYGRRLKGPVLVSRRQFTKAVAGNGIGITTNDSKRPLRIPRDAENKHFLIVGDTGSGKSSIIRQMLYQVDARGDSAIVYDPACEFVKQFYDEHRGDIVLNPLDARMPYWNPSKELRRKAEAKALAVSLYQPEGVTNRFFVEAPQKIFAHLLSLSADAGGTRQVDVRSRRDRPPRQGNRVLDAD